MNTVPCPRSSQVKSLPKGFAKFFAVWLLGFAIFPLAAFSQEEITIDGKACGIHGNAKQSEAYALNAFKNRYTAPRASDFDTAITLHMLANSGDPNQFSQDKAAVLRGYVYDVKMGGVESCNCETKDPQFRDTHIELVPDETHTDAQYRVIAEVTPRLRVAMQQRGLDWSTTALRKSIKGRWVELAGWLTYDVEHESAAYANDPDDAIGQHNWRATVWEVHPITYLKVIQKGQANSLSSIVKAQGGFSNESSGEGKAISGNSTGQWLVIGILLVFVIAFFLLQKRKR